MKKMLLSIFVLMLLASCTSVKKYNEQITTLHSVEDLHSDIDKLYKQLKSHHPKLYQYTPKEQLDFKFDSLKQSIKTPIDSRTFYKKLAPVVTNIRQGHVSVSSVGKRFNRKERKQLLKKKFEFYNLDFEYLEDKLWVKATRGKDSLLIGSQVVSIDNEPAKDLVETFKTRFASDGFNTTLHNRYVSKGFSTFYYKDKGFVDSLQVTFKNKDSIFTRTLKRISKGEKNKKKRKDSLKKTAPKKLTKTEKKAQKLAKKKKRKDNRKYGYVPKYKQFTRNFNFIGNDSTVAYMKIRGFSNGNYKKFYKESFAKMDALNTKHFILDLRDNGGGRVSEIDKLYSYLTDKKYIFLEPVEVNDRLPITTFLLSNGNTTGLKILGGLSIINPISLSLQYLHTKKDKGKMYFKMKYNKLRKPNPLNYKGEIYVLINGNSFSASSLISTHLKATNRAVFVGEETGGAYNGCVSGFYKNYELPNTKLKVRIGLMQIEAPYKQTPDGYGIRPDIEVLPTVKDRASNRDPELDWVLRNIGKI